MKLCDVMHGQCFRFKSQKAVWVMADDDYMTQIIGNHKGRICERYDFRENRQVEFVEIVEVT